MILVLAKVGVWIQTYIRRILRCTRLVESCMLGHLSCWLLCSEAPLASHVSSYKQDTTGVSAPNILSLETFGRQIPVHRRPLKHGEVDEQNVKAMDVGHS